MTRRPLLPRRDRAAGGDDGAALIIALVIVLMGSLIITPLLNYAVTVTNSSRVEVTKTAKAEAVKGALRVALADGKALYAACANSGLHTEVALAGPQLTTGVTTTCTTVANSTETQASDLRVALEGTQVGATAPVGVVGTPYAGIGGSNINAWVNDTTTASTGGKILLPQLPSHALNHPSSTGYAMPAWAGNCTVFFPGTYVDPITISSSTPVYFTSGIYYFENTITFTGSANVVIGGGTVDGCTTDQDAAYNAINAPLNPNITGYGATFILGKAARLIVNDSVAGTGPVVQFNNRLVADTDVADQPTKGVSIESVNGVVQSVGVSSSDLNLSGQIYVPKSLVSGTPAVDAESLNYNPSTLVPTASGAQTAGIIDFSFTGTGKGTLYVPGYVSVPQGVINVSVTATSKVSKQMSLVGGVLAGVFTTSATPAATQQIGLVNRVVQKTFKIVSRTTTGGPYVTGTALVMVNDYGEYVVNSWSLESGA